MAQGDFGLSDAEMWSDPFRTRRETDRRLHRAGFAGLCMDAPAVVDLDAHDTLPLLVYHADTLRALARCSFPNEAVLVGTRLEDHLTLAATAIYRDEAEPQVADPNAKPPPDGTGSQVHLLDAHERLELPWDPAHWLFRVLLRDKTSDSVRVRLRRPSAAPRAGDDGLGATLVGAHLSVEPPMVPPPWPVPGTPFPFYGQAPDSLAPPSAPAGIVLSMPRVVVLEDEARCVLRGAFRLVPLFGERLPLKVGIGGTFVGPGGTEPTAVLAITLVVVGVEHPSVFVVPLRVPSFQPFSPLLPAPQVVGRFAIDLLATEGFPPVPQSYHLHAFAGEVASASVPFALVDEEALLPV